MSKIIPKITFLLHNVDSGGVERVSVNLLKELIKYPILIDLVLFKKQGNFLAEVPPEVRVIELPNASSGRLRRIFPLMHYLRRERPSVLISQLVQFNIIAVIAKFLSGIPMHVLLVEHLGFNSLENKLINNFNEKIGFLNFLRRFFYPRSNMVAAVSQGLATELEHHLNMRSGTINVLYNSVLDQNLTLKAQSPLDHLWFKTGEPPVFLAVGRLAPQKDFSTLIKAFSIFRQKHVARLMILGEGAERQQLEAEISQLNLEMDVSLPGFTENPYAYMSQASAFVLSSRFEALPTVVIEALACGCQVIATDCLHGPNEILMEGKYGSLVPVGDAQALADAMEKAITNPIDSDFLRLRAHDFTPGKTVIGYLKAMNLACLSE